MSQSGTEQAKTFLTVKLLFHNNQNALFLTPPDAGRRAERHPAGDGSRRRHQMLRQRPGHQRTSQPLPARQDHVGPAAGHVQPVQPGRRLAHHEQEEGVPHHAARQAGQLLHQGRRRPETRLSKRVNV